MAKSTSHRMTSKHKKPNVRLRPEPVIRRNARDRSEDAEGKRRSHVTMSFLGFGGLMRSLISYAVKLSEGGSVRKLGRSTAAKSRAASFRHYLQDDPEKMRSAFVRHLHPRSKRTDKVYCDAEFEKYLAYVRGEKAHESGSL